MKITRRKLFSALLSAPFAAIGLKFATSKLALAEYEANLQFAAGNQWPPALVVQRRAMGRPCLTINRIDGFVAQIVNEHRMRGCPLSPDEERDLMASVANRLKDAQIQFNVAYSDLVYSAGKRSRDMFESLWTTKRT